MKPFKVKIVQCSGSFWYAPLVGKVIEVTDFDDYDFTYYNGSIIRDKGCGYVWKNDCQYLNGTPAGHTQWYLTMKYVAAIYTYLTKHGIDTKDKGLIRAAYNHIYGCNSGENFADKFLALHDKIARIAPIFERHEKQKRANLRISKHWLGSHSFDNGRVQVYRSDARTFHIAFGDSQYISSVNPREYETFQGRAPRVDPSQVLAKVKGYNYIVPIIYQAGMHGWWIKNVEKWYVKKNYENISMI
jgi:hypothetical protein